MPETCMTSTDVIDFYTTLENLGIEMWVDGGWGVDALLGKQKRPHKDLDIAIQQKDVPKLRALLEVRGYKEIKLEEAQPWNFVLGDDKDHEIDVHVILFDDKRNGLYGPVEKGIMYPAASLTGRIRPFQETRLVFTQGDVFSWFLTCTKRLSEYR